MITKEITNGRRVIYVESWRKSNSGSRFKLRRNKTLILESSKITKKKK